MIIQWFTGYIVNENNTADFTFCVRNKSMKKPRLISYINTFLVIVSLTFTSRVFADVSVAVSKTPLSTPWYIAEHQGFFKKERVNVKIVDMIGGHRCLKAMLSGEVNMATTSDSPIAFQSLHNKKFKILTTFVTSYNDVKLMTKKSSGILKARHLIGKKVGTVIGASSHYFLVKFLIDNNVNPNKIEVVHVKPNAMPKALASGEVDAISVWEPYGYISKSLLKDDLHILPAKKTYRETFNLVSNEKFIINNEKNAEKIIRALKNASDFIQNKPEKAKRIVYERLKLDGKFVDSIWDDFNFNLKLDQLLITTIEDQAYWLIESKRIKTTLIPKYLDFIDKKYLRD